MVRPAPQADSIVLFFTGSELGALSIACLRRIE